jgi:predicted acyl esterase
MGLLRERPRRDTLLDVHRGARLSVACFVLAVTLMAAGGAAEASFSAHGSVEQVYATGLKPHERMTLLGAAGNRVAHKRASYLGALLFRNVKPGKGYRVQPSGGGPKSPKLTVLTKRSAPPSKSIYDQTMPTKGYGYLTTRDGTKLAYYVHPPQDVTTVLPGVQPPDLTAGPQPTLIEYSGYGYANPAGPTNGIAILANLMGFTVVDVNMRGTGCSGGAYDFFEPLQNLDGYDVIETVARQPWVKFHRVGMMGISYGGISQLFTAQTRPPSLAAISPLSVIDATQTTLYPGGVLNTGFAVAWAKERIQEAKPASKDAGQRWAYDRIQEGDQTCKQNQVMHSEAADLERKIHNNDHYRPKVVDPLTPITFVNKIDVPTYLVCQWTDEQTGGHCPTLAEHFTGTRRKWFTFTNGTHVDSLGPEQFNRWYDFLMLYVARQAPITNAAKIQAAGPVIYEEAMGISGVTMPPDPIQSEPTYQSALAAFEKLGSIRILFDNGAGGSDPGQPKPGFERSFARFPIPGTAARSWFMAAGGKLANKAPAASGADKFTWDAHARALTDFTGSTSTGDNGLWTATPRYHWLLPPSGTGLTYLSGRLARDTTVIGAGAVHAWVRSSKPSVDLQVAISEVRPDGRETFVQNGWLRADERKLDKRKSTLLEPWPSFRARDVRRMPKGKFAKVIVPLYYEGHVYRMGSRIRVTISAPNGEQPIWSFSETKPKGKATVAIAHSRKRPSSLILPVVPGGAPTGLPPCPGLRGEPCRDYKPFVNRSAGR